MSNWDKKAKDVRSRANQPNHMFSYCRVIHCGQPARAGTADGLDRLYCRRHADHYQRHGSPTKPSYPAKVINPYRQAALVWLLDHEDDFWVKDAVGKVLGLYQRSGPQVEAFRLRGLPPRERSKALWARLRASEVDPRLLVAAWLAVEMVLRDDPQAELKTEYKRVQAAKIVHRMASGTHKRWDRERPHPLHHGLPPIKEVEEKHWYPKSRGRVLRHIGQDLGGAVELLVDHRLEEIEAFKVKRDQRGTYDWSPYPRGYAAKRKDRGDG